MVLAATMANNVVVWVDVERIVAEFVSGVDTFVASDATLVAEFAEGFVCFFLELLVCAVRNATDCSCLNWFIRKRHFASD